jgi:hypothetical protein
MRFLNLAFVMTAVVVSAPLSFAQEGISPEVFAACEAKTPNDFKQQLACVKEQSNALDALNDLKTPKSRQIAVEPKVEEDAEQASTLGNAGAEDYCSDQYTSAETKPKWQACVDSEKAAHGEIAAALASIDSDIPGDPYTACRNYIFAYQPEAAKVYVPQVFMLQCLKAKAPTRDFGVCYQNFENRLFNRDVTTVSAENIGRVADCFFSKLAGAP